MVTGFEPFFPLVVSAIGAAVVSFGGLLLGRKLGLTPTQAQYVAAMEGLNDALDKKVELLEENATDSIATIASFSSQLKTRNDEISDLKQENFVLRQELADCSKHAIALASKDRLGFSNASKRNDQGG